jgi:hypothetical protein
MCVCACVRFGLFMRVHASSLVYPVRNSYAPYCDVIVAPRYPPHFFRHYLIKGAIFGKKLWYMEGVFFYFLYNFYLKHFSF